MANQKIIIDFWDVGQGDGSVIRLPDGKLILIDVGPRNSPIIDWLADNNPNIHAVTISHNDFDHAGCLPSLVKMPGIVIGTIFMLLDRDKKSAIFQNLWRPVQEEEAKKRFSVLQLTTDTVIWQDGDNCLKVIYPNFVQNINAVNPNETSAVISLLYKGETKIVWGGDAPMQIIADKCKDTFPYLLMGPHHGAPIDRNHADFKKWVNDLEPERVFISVGSNNKYQHPKIEYLKLQVDRKCLVNCTQLTTLCDRKHIKEQMPVLQTAGLLGLRAARTGVSCRGCFRLTVTNGSIIPDAWDAEHLKRVRLLHRPKCL